MPNYYSPRTLLLSGFILCLLLLAGGYFIEYQLLIEPCSLCLLQRFVYYVVGSVFLLAAIHNPKNCWNYVYGAFNFCAAIMGALLAGRQLWLQHLPPDQLPACTPGLERLLKIHPLFDSILIILHGAGECGKEKFKLFGFSLAYWSLFGFILIMVLCWLIIYSQAKKRRT